MMSHFPFFTPYIIIYCSIIYLFIPPPPYPLFLPSQCFPHPFNVLDSAHLLTELMCIHMEYNHTCIKHFINTQTEACIRVSIRSGKSGLVMIGQDIAVTLGMVRKNMEKLGKKSGKTERLKIEKFCFVKLPCPKIFFRAVNFKIFSSYGGHI